MGVVGLATVAWFSPIRVPMRHQIALMAMDERPDDPYDPWARLAGKAPPFTGANTGMGSPPTGINDPYSYNVRRARHARQETTQNTVSKDGSLHADLEDSSHDCDQDILQMTEGAPDCVGKVAITYDADNVYDPWSGRAPPFAGRASGVGSPPTGFNDPFSAGKIKPVAQPDAEAERPPPGYRYARKPTALDRVLRGVGAEGSTSAADVEASPSAPVPTSEGTALSLLLRTGRLSSLLMRIMCMILGVAERRHLRGVPQE